MLPISASTIQNGTIDEALVQAKAQELCVFDWNRKPRGPKCKKAAFAAAFGVDTSVNSQGAPRSHVSAGPAYMEAQKRVLDEAQHSNHPLISPDSAFTFTPPDEAGNGAAWPDLASAAPAANGAPHYDHYASTSAMPSAGSSYANASSGPSYTNGRPALYPRGSNESSNSLRPSTAPIHTVLDNLTAIRRCPRSRRQCSRHLPRDPWGPKRGRSSAPHTSRLASRTA